ncbi:MAG TPA: flagellar assembly protein FliX [Rickettsiales bacterium]|nr:flagellar assembly protein FliX [Rickettsiales bacterium]
MKIGEYSPVGKTGATGKKKGTSSVGGGDFLGLLSTGETESASASQPTSDVQSVSMDALLSLQEMPDNEVARRQAMQEGSNIIETLDKLRLDLLTGKVSGNLLNRLNDLTRIKHQFTNDPRLESIIQDIELRAAVELAKLERAAKDN